MRLNEEEATLVDTVRGFVDREVKPTVREVEHANEYPKAWIEQMKRNEQKCKYLPVMATGQMRATMALTEPGGGSDL